MHGTLKPIKLLNEIKRSHPQLSRSQSKEMIVFSDRLMPYKRCRLSWLMSWFRRALIIRLERNAMNECDLTVVRCETIRPVHTMWLRAWVTFWGRSVECHSRARRNIFAGSFWGENFGIFLFKTGHFGVLYIFERRWGSLNVAGPRVTFPRTPLSTGLFWGIGLLHTPMIGFGKASA